MGTDTYVRSCRSAELFVNGTQLKMTLDTGATVTISMAKAITTLEALIFQVTTYTGESLKVQGEAQVRVHVLLQVKLPLVVYCRVIDIHCYVSRNWLQRLLLIGKKSSMFQQHWNDLFTNIEHFNDELGTMVTGKTFCKPDRARTTPCAL